MATKRNVIKPGVALFESPSATPANKSDYAVTMDCFCSRQYIVNNVGSFCDVDAHGERNRHFITQVLFQSFTQSIQSLNALQQSTKNS